MGQDLLPTGFGTPGACGSPRYKAELEQAHRVLRRPADQDPSALAAEAFRRVPIYQTPLGVIYRVSDTLICNIQSVRYSYMKYMECQTRGPGASAARTPPARAAAVSALRRLPRQYAFQDASDHSNRTPSPSNRTSSHPNRTPGPSNRLQAVCFGCLASLALPEPT